MFFLSLKFRVLKIFRCLFISSGEMCCSVSRCVGGPHCATCFSLSCVRRSFKGMFPKLQLQMGWEWHFLIGSVTQPVGTRNVLNLWHWKLKKVFFSGNKLILVFPQLSFNCCIMSLTFTLSSLNVPRCCFIPSHYDPVTFWRTVNG